MYGPSGLNIEKLNFLNVIGNMEIYQRGATCAIIFNLVKQFVSMPFDLISLFV